MDQQEGDFLSEGMAVRFGLAQRGLHRNDHIAEEMWVRRWETLLLWKRQDIGGMVAAEVRPIETPDGPITDEEYRDLTLRSAQGG